MSRRRVVTDARMAEAYLFVSPETLWITYFESGDFNVISNQNWMLE